MVAGDDFAGGLRIRIAQRIHGLGDLILHHAAHPEHDAVQARQLLVEALEGVLFAAHHGRLEVSRVVFSRIGR